jgi:hypothetical protein
VLSQKPINGLTMPSIPTLEIIVDTLKAEIGFFFTEREEKGYIIRCRESGPGRSSPLKSRATDQKSDGSRENKKNDCTDRKGGDVSTVES